MGSGMQFNLNLTLKSILTLSLLGSTLVAYQNCGKAGFEGALGNEDLSAVDKTSAGAPFAFKVDIDQISYNSCADRFSNARDKQSMATFRFGSYYNSGVSVNKNFIEYANQELKPIYPNVAITKEQVKKLISTSPINKDVKIQVSLRNSENLNQIVFHESAANASDPVLNRDVTQLLGSLSDDRWLNTIVPNEVRKEFFNETFQNYFANSPTNSQTRIEGALAMFNSSYANANNLREAIESNNYSLFVGFSNKSNLSEVSGLNNNVATGKRYELRFQKPDGAHHLSESNILSSLEEYDVSKNPAELNTTNLWSCEPVKIIREKDAPIECPSMETDELISNPDMRSRLAQIRNSLPSETWEVNVSDRNGFCAIPRTALSNACYNSQYRIAYQPDELCYSVSNDPLDNSVKASIYGVTIKDDKFVFSSEDNLFADDVVGYAGQPKVTWIRGSNIEEVKLCAQYVSVCFRQ